MTAPRKNPRFTDQERASKFKYWFKWNGHWIYTNQQEALIVWSSQGIDGLPSCTPGALALLCATSMAERGLL